MPIKRKTRRILNQPGNLRPREVLCQRRQFIKVDVRRQNVIGTHLLSVNFEDLKTTFLVGKVDFHFHFETAGSEEGFINHVETVCHADDKDVVELVDAVHFGEELVYDCVAHTGAAACSTTLFGDRIEFVEYNNVEITGVAFFFVLPKLRQYVSRVRYIFFCIGEEFADVLFTLTNVFVEDFGTVDDFRFFCIQHFTDLAGHQSLSCTWWSIQ